MREADALTSAEALSTGGRTPTSMAVAKRKPTGGVGSNQYQTVGASRQKPRDSRVRAFAATDPTGANPVTPDDDAARHEEAVAAWMALEGTGMNRKLAERLQLDWGHVRSPRDAGYTVGRLQAAGPSDDRSLADPVWLKQRWSDQDPTAYNLGILEGRRVGEQLSRAIPALVREHHAAAAAPVRNDAVATIEARRRLASGLWGDHELADGPDAAELFDRIEAHLAIEPGEVQELLAARFGRSESLESAAAARGVSKIEARRMEMAALSRIRSALARPVRLTA